MTSNPHYLAGLWACTHASIHTSLLHPVFISQLAPEKSQQRYDYNLFCSISLSLFGKNILNDVFKPGKFTFAEISFYQFSKKLFLSAPSYLTHLTQISQLQVSFLTTPIIWYICDPEVTCITLPIWATDSKQSTGPFQTDMKSLVFLLVLTLCYLCKAQKDNGDNDNLLQAGGERELEVQSDVWVELMVLKEQMAEQKVLLQHLTTRVTAAESRVEDLQDKNTGRLKEEALYGKNRISWA